MDSNTHGRSGYAKRKCRCDICTTAQRDYMREYQRRRAAEGRPIPRTTFPCVCELCGSEHASPRRESRYCGLKCQWDAAARTSWSSAGERAEERRRLRRLPVPYVRPVFHSHTRRVEAQRRLSRAAAGTTAASTKVSGHCTVCTKSFIAHGLRVTSRTCSAACQDAHMRDMRRVGKDRRRARKRSAFVANVYRKRVFEADGYRCHLCNRKTDATKHAPHPKAPTVDHVIPLGSGGTHEPSNCRTACFLCNSRKGDRGGGEQFALAM